MTRFMTRTRVNPSDNRFHDCPASRVLYTASSVATYTNFDLAG